MLKSKPKLHTLQPKPESKPSPEGGGGVSLSLSPSLSLALIKDALNTTDEITRIKVIIRVRVRNSVRVH